MDQMDHNMNIKSEKTKKDTGIIDLSDVRLRFLETLESSRDKIEKQRGETYTMYKESFALRQTEFHTLFDEKIGEVETMGKAVKENESRIHLLRKNFETCEKKLQAQGTGHEDLTKFASKLEAELRQEVQYM